MKKKLEKMFKSLFAKNNYNFKSIIIVYIA